MAMKIIFIEYVRMRCTLVTITIIILEVYLLNNGMLEISFTSSTLVKCRTLIIFRLKKNFPFIRL